MKTTAIVAAALAVLLCCLGVLCAALFGLGLLAGLPESVSFNYPPASPTPLPVPIVRSTSAAANATFETLIRTLVPENDPAELAYRLGVVSEPVPETMPAPESPLQIGETRTFWSADTDSSENFQLTAALVYITPHTYFWVEDGVDYDLDQLQALADDFENHTYPTVRAFFGSEWSPGIDNDPRVYIVYARNIGVDLAGYFSSADEIHPLVNEYSNAHEMFFLSADNLALDETFTYGVLAHEFQHMIHWNSDRNETTWVNEGFSEVAALLTGYYNGGFDYRFARDPDIPLTVWPQDGDRVPHYGGAFLFLAYFLDRYGEPATRQLAADPANGFTAINDVLSRLGEVDALRGALPGGADLFQDFAVTLYLNDPDVADGRFAYSVYPQAPTARATETVADCPGGEQLRDVNQFGIDIIRITCRGDHTLVFQGSTSTPVLPVEPHSGDYAFWSNRGDEADTRLTQRFDFSSVTGELTLQYWVWTDIEVDYDYAYLLASTDGERWQILTTPRGTGEDPSGNSYGWGYNGSTGGWVQERVDLSAYAGQQVWLRFEYITDAAVVGEGLLLDDVAIPEIGYSSDFESGDGGWQADGFVRLANAIPQTYRLTLVAVGEGGSTVTYLDLEADNVLEIPIHIGGEVDELVLLVSGTTRFTAQKTGYLFEIKP